MKAFSFIGLAALSVVACSSSSGGTDGSSGSSGGTSGASTSGGNSSGSGGGTDMGCTITFGGDASSVKASTCSLLGPSVSDATDFSFRGSVEGLDSPLFTFSIKYPNGVTAKTYETKDLFYISANLSVVSTGKIYSIDYDSMDATKTRHGSVKTVFTSDKHGTIDATYDTEDPPVAHATVKITF